MEIEPTPMGQAQEQGEPMVHRRDSVKELINRRVATLQLKMNDMLVLQAMLPTVMTDTQERAVYNIISNVAH